MICLRPAARLLGLVLAWACLWLSGPWLAGAEVTRSSFSIPGGDAALTLRQLSRQAHESVVFPIDLVHGCQTHPVRGEYTAREAAERMTAGTELFVTQDPQTGALLIGRRTPPGNEVAQSPPSSSPLPSPMKPRTPFAAIRAFFGLALAPLPLTAVEAGRITGSVNNSATGDLLEGARVEIPALGRQVLTDVTGRFELMGVPDGTHEVSAAYSGLDTLRVTVTVTAGQRVERNFDLTSEIYKLEAFQVTGEREGNAAMVTEKKNASNVKEVIAMDSFGYLPNMSVGEVVGRLPGVAGVTGEEDLVSYVNIRGMGLGLNSLTIDGQSIPSANLNRNVPLDSINGNFFDSVEVVKGHTPDRNADSLGGTINLKSKSPLAMRERRRTTYNLSTRWAPPFLEQTPMRSQHRAHPILNVAHQEVLDMFGESRNLALSVNVFYSELAIGSWNSLFGYTNVTNGPAPVWDYRTQDNTNNRKQWNLSVRADHRLTPHAKFSIGLIGNNAFEHLRKNATVRAFTGGATTVPNATTTGVVPGQFTDRVTVVRPVAAANIDVSMNGPLNFDIRLRRIDTAADYQRGPLLLEYAGSVSTSHLNTGAGRGGQLNMRLGSVNPSTRLFTYGGAGWIFDRTQDALHPQFIQNGGPDFTDPNNYRPRPTDGLYQFRDERDHQVKQFRLDGRFTLPLPAPTYLKGGFHWREQRMDTWGGDRHRWEAAPGANPLPPDPSYVSYDRVKTGRAIPIWQASMFTNDGRPADKAYWIENLYYNREMLYTQTRWLTEEIPAYYVMMQGRLAGDGLLRRTGYLGGLRVEETKTLAKGWVPGRSLSTTAQRAADPVGSADRDYSSNYRVNPGEYRKRLPSLHVYHDFTRDLKIRASYSTSFGRPDMANLFPGETPNESTQTVTVNNPGLGPYTAQNWDMTLEYYFEPVGSLTVAWFHKEIRDYIVTSDVGTIGEGAGNGFGGQYAGWTARTNANGGDATAQGWEFAYSQQFTFLPGALKGLAGSFNYSWVNTHGRRGGTQYLTRREVEGFIPHTANASLSWRYRRFSARILYNFTGEHISSYNATSPALNQYRFSRKLLNLGAGYQLRPAVGLSVDVVNALNEPQRYYQAYKQREYRTFMNFTTVTIGVNGRF